MTVRNELTIRLPAWLLEAATPRVIADRDARMQYVLELTRENIRHKTGGPFGSAVFERDSGRLVAAGVNLVTTSGFTMAHAEMVAIMAAQEAVGDYQLGRPGKPALEVVASTAPCAMCLGAIPWAGVAGLVCGARDQDARAIGFDEGAKPHDWREHYARRGIAVVEDVLREQAIAVLEEYRDSGGEIY